MNGDTFPFKMPSIGWQRVQEGLKQSKGKKCVKTFGSPSEHVGAIFKTPAKIPKSVSPSKPYVRHCAFHVYSHKENL